MGENTPPEAAAAAVPPAGRQRRWGSFSLGALFCALIVVTLAVSNLVTSRKLNQAEQEVARLRVAAGYLSPEHPEQIHVFAIPQTEDLHWKWRIRLPQGHKYTLHHTERAIPLTGFPDVQSGITLPAGDEELLEASVHKNATGQWTFRLMGTNYSMSTAIAPADMEWRDRPTRNTVSQTTGSGSEKITKPGPPLTLVRLRDIQGLTQPAAETNGVLIWITCEPVAAPPGSP